MTLSTSSVPNLSILPDNIEPVIEKAAQALLDTQKQDGHWVFELEADATIPAEYILLRHYLGEPEDLELEAKIGRYLRRIQGDHGGWPLFYKGGFDISATVKAYFALKMIGDSPDEPHMQRAREEILAHGGAITSNVFTRLQLALYGAIPWETVPQMPVEMMLLPDWFPIHINKMSYWARTVLVPLLVLQAVRPLAKNPRGILVDELFVPGATVPARADGKWVWKIGFGALDKVLHKAESFWPKANRKKAIDACVNFVSERLNGEDGLGGIYPAIANSVMMYDALGYPEDHPERAIARKAVEKLLVFNPEEQDSDDEIYCQPCLSPIWDTALAAHAMLEVGGDKAEKAAIDALNWLEPQQILDVKGDWAWQKPDLRPGGWAFQYNNAYYPDVDDTAVVVMAMDRAGKLPEIGSKFEESKSRAIEWTLGMQSDNGGWGAFDANNTYYYLNNIPFADHGALLDPPTVDVSARCVSMLAQAGKTLQDDDMKTAVHYLFQEQEKDGSWFGRWGVNYIYGTWSALCALNAADIPHDHLNIRRAVQWLESIQNEDGGWGEDCDSYALDYKGYQPAVSTPSQTAWALLGLMAVGETDSTAVARGINWLANNQDEHGFWKEDYYSGGGFPRVFYLRYHGYSKYFPLWALARYRNLSRANQPKVAYGM
ncbi:MAG: squalene--hopene cyclase [Zymomonas mobilis subsp. pomaceae]|uniref:Squalene-hopene cyclase n=1 Tax=Zymomonas mobilis subsp. pomaceae (strain ATCC 29192 / DSM 22645 / JCM 10191 / CCUG 17912 / NBRC 13757 / NCIMB 11200 / NRRL B-4491 / Barker I) TaxID=579138 RepID=F8EV08_ZYMMT|nr:squalene--hopene cyclase [Zymomonas mobilis]AEI37296.1 squalene-hopene cyclase [Zymomonas mobilis subsp. pomaceae ATCC 29192]MDX5948665.1 squalene--hopene cyclase [Zymomonas mobilis subsp. pomaceae]GEB88470.1 squalene-hopene cyclase [Zymomonas mobilis subsp. pomaceae]